MPNTRQWITVTNTQNNGALVDLPGFTPTVDESANDQGDDENTNITLSVSLPSVINVDYDVAANGPAYVRVDVGDADDPATGQPLSDGDRYRVVIFDSPVAAAIVAINANTDAEVAAAIAAINDNTDAEVAAAIAAINDNTDAEIAIVVGLLGGAGTVPIGPYETPSPGSVPIAGVEVTIWSNSGMTTPVPGQPTYTTQISGFVFANGLTPGTYYVKGVLAGYTFNNPFTLVVT